MNRKVLTMDIKNDALNAARVMAKYRISSLILTKQGKPVAVVTERDFLRAVCARDAKASQIPLENMSSSSLVTIEPTAPIEVASNLMALNRVRHLLVIDDNEQLVGIITSTDLARYLRHGHNSNSFYNIA
ncbi:MAG: CBS domain-containing protein [Nitrososphaerales archaeon]